MLCDLTELTEVYSPHLPANSRHFVAGVCTSGLQPCLIECPRDGYVELIDALIVLPSDTPFVCAGTDPVYSAALVAIRSLYGPHIRQLSETPKLLALASTPRNKPPFTPTPQRLLVESAHDAARSTAKSLTPASPELSRLNAHLTRFIDPNSGSMFWTPQYVLAGGMRTDERGRIIAQWRHWEASGFSWDERAEEHRKACSPYSPETTGGAIDNRCGELGLTRGEAGTSTTISSSVGVVWGSWSADGFLPAGLVKPKSRRRSGVVNPRTVPFP